MSNENQLVVLRKLTTSSVAGVILGSPNIAKQFGHLFTPLSASLSLGLGFGISLSIRVIDGILSKGKLGEWMKNHQYVKGFASLTLTEMTAAVAAVAFGAPSVISVAALTTAIWFAIKGTDTFVDYWVASSKEKAEYNAYKGLVESINPQELFKKIGCDRIACCQKENTYKFYSLENGEPSELWVGKEVINNAIVMANEMYNIDLKINEIDLKDVKNNRYIKPLQDQAKRYLAIISIFASIRDNESTVENKLEALSKNEFLKEAMQQLSEESAQKLEQNKTR